MSLSGFRQVIDQAYDLPELNKHVDIINVMTYDYHGFWDQETNHHSPLIDSGDKNVEFILNYVNNGGIDADKIHMGIPLYGQSYRLQSANNNGMGAPTTGRGQAGQYTKQSGMLAYYEICSDKAFKTVPGSNNHGPYSYRGNQWVSYDDPEMAGRKASFILAKGYGGVALWTIDFDDFNNMCCTGPNPIINTVSKVLRGSGTLPTPGNCARPPPVSTPAPAFAETTAWDSGSAESATTTTTSWTTATTTTTVRTTTASGNNEVDEEGGSCVPGQLYAHPVCEKFYQCIMGKKQAYTCPAGLHFNPTISNCDWKANVDCGSRSSK